MAKTMHVEVVSAEKSLLSADITELYARSVDGEIGILPGHQPALIALDIAPLKVRFEDSTEERIAIHNGFLFIDRRGVIVLADRAELASQIDVPRAERKLAEMERRLEAEERLKSVVKVVGIGDHITGCCDRDEAHHRNETQSIPRYMTQRNAHRNQNERKFADLCNSGPRQKARALAITHSPHDREHDQGLTQEDKKRKHECRNYMLTKEGEVERGAEGNEKEKQQKIAKWREAR